MMGNEGVDDKIDKLLRENLLLEAFIDVKSSKVTAEKVTSKLHYLRMKEKLSTLENALKVANLDV